jgi:AraC-like DNA-binding protein
MDYRELEVPEVLRRHVRCVWRLRLVGPSKEAQTIYPDGCCELIVNLGQPMQAFSLERGWEQQARCLFAAQQRSAIRLAAVGPVDCIGVRLRPAASAAVARERLPSLRDRIVDMGDLNSELAQDLAAAARAFVSCADGAALWQVLEARLLDYAIDGRLENAIAALEAVAGIHRIDALAEAAQMGLRTFQIRFLECVGLRPKEFARVLRLQATLRELDRSDEGLAHVALESGFSDQAHATRELHDVTGLTPARLRRALRGTRDADQTIQLAAAFVRGSG